MIRHTRCFTRLATLFPYATLYRSAHLPVYHPHDVALQFNDRQILAIKFGADGVHVGQEDETYAEARRILGADRIVGVTCHASRHLAMEAAEAGADYVAFGAFFPDRKSVV